MWGACLKYSWWCVVVTGVRCDSCMCISANQGRGILCYVAQDGVTSISTQNHFRTGLSHTLAAESNHATPRFPARLRHLMMGCVVKYRELHLLL